MSIHGVDVKWPPKHGFYHREIDKSKSMLHLITEIGKPGKNGKCECVFCMALHLFKISTCHNASSANLIRLKEGISIHTCICTSWANLDKNPGTAVYLGKELLSYIYGSVSHFSGDSFFITYRSEPWSWVALWFITLVLAEGSTAVVLLRRLLNYGELLCK